MLDVIGAAIVLFATTNVDDIFVLLSLFSSQQFRPRQIVIGQCLGFAALVAVSLMASLISLLVKPELVGWLGLLPIAIGVRKLFARRVETGDPEKPTAAAGPNGILAVAGITLANGGDNIGIYVPVFATSSKVAILIFCAVFVWMVAAWLMFAHWLVNHRSLGRPIRRYGHIVTPLVLILTGLYILIEAGSMKLLL
jgi:cadmium resistance protein CadD (predicted permease)